MTAQLLIGKSIGAELTESLKSQAEEQRLRSGKPIRLTTILIGDAQDAVWYSRAIGKMCSNVGIVRQELNLNDAVSTQDAIDEIRKHIADENPTGILLLSPVPAKVNYGQVLNSIPPSLDAEGSRYQELAQFGSTTYPPTALAVVETILAAGQPLEGKNAVVVGRSSIVGRPAADLLLKHNATVTICHSKTVDLKFHIENADIVIAAAGKANLIKGDWIKKGAIVSDAAENEVDGKPVGDVEFEAAKERAAFITPVPQGVGPLTTLMLAKNLLCLAKLSTEKV